MQSTELLATCPVSIVGVERVFLGQTTDQHFPLLLDLDVCLSTLAQGHGTEEMVHVGVLWGVGGVLGEVADVEAAIQDDGFQDGVVASLECSAEEGGCAIGCHGQSKGPLRVREGA